MFDNKIEKFLIIISLLLIKYSDCRLSPFTRNDEILYKEKILKIFYESYNNYIENAINYDELMPITCMGINTWGTFSLSLIDTLDMLILVENYTEFNRIAKIILDKNDFDDKNTNVSVFETNIRVVGGLLSAHLFSYRSNFQIENGWPCTGPLLRLAEKVARKLLPAFNTSTGMPYGTINLKYGVPENETPITCTAGVGTFLIEFGTLSRLTGDPIFEQVALRAIYSLQKYRSKIGLLGNHINVQNGKWTVTDSGIGAGIDSYFEYLVKGSILLRMPNLMEIFNYDYELIKKYLRKNDWFIWVNMISGQTTMPIYQSLESFFPGLLTLIGDIDQARKSLYNYHQIWKQYGFLPEFYDIINGKYHKQRYGYPLRPEFIESVYYLYRSTGDKHLLMIGADVVDSIYYSSRTKCGYATIKSVADHTIEDRMESFFLAETLKYLYLLFDRENFINDNNGSIGKIINNCIVETGSYIFNTEAHPIDVSALDCCHKHNNLDDNIDLYELFIERSEKNLQKNLFFINNLSINDDDKDDDNFKTEQNHSIIEEIFGLKKFENNTHCYQIFNNENEDLIKQNIPILINSNDNDTTNIVEYLYLNLNQFNDNDDDDDDGGGDNFDQNENFINTKNYEKFKCPSQSFLLRLSLYGQIFM